MKNALHLVALMAIVMFFGINSADAKNSKGDSKIKFTETSHDFGIVDENGGNVSYEFEFINEGLGNLVILEARSQCGCTRPEYPKNPIAPGKKGKIKVTYMPKGRPGSINRTITVMTNGKPSKSVLQIKGRVVPKENK